MASTDTLKDIAPVAGKPATLLGWRGLALFYDLWPAAALWMAAAALFLLAHGNQPLPAFSPLQLLLWLVCWLLTGAYALMVRADWHIHTIIWIFGLFISSVMTAIWLRHRHDVVH